MGWGHAGRAPARRADAPRAHRCPQLRAGRALRARSDADQAGARGIRGAGRRAQGPPAVTRVKRVGAITFAALSVPNYRRFVRGQAISLIGTWMQMAAQAWLVLTLTHSATDLGIIVALQTLPVLLLAPYGGVIADRVDKRRLMVVLQSVMGIQALVLGLLTVTGVV